jgi:2'-5' RNA ligase
MGISEPSGSLHIAHQTLKSTLEQLGFPTEKRAFSPHLTLARIKSPLTPGQLQILQKMLDRYRFSFPNYRVTHFYVMKSELFRFGARYTCLEACPLQSAAR